tara:strand:- start:1630 stop:1890 length:261 start_codon:yes stop_codon:yes gene_type:complete
MDIENLIKNIKVKLLKNTSINHVQIEDKTYLHLKHSSHQKNKFHVKLTIESDYLKKMSKLEASKKIHKIIEYEIKNFIHSIQILIK